MADDTKPTLLETTKYGFWRYIGAMFTEPKGEDGEHAVSLTRVLAFFAFCICAYCWVRGVEATMQAFEFLLLVCGLKGLGDGVKAWKAPALPAPEQPAA